MSCCGVLIAWASLVVCKQGSLLLFPPFDPSVHLTDGDLQAGSLENPTCFKGHIKCSKTDPFSVGCDIYVGHGDCSVCPILAVGCYLQLRGSATRPLFMYDDSRSLTHPQLSSTVQCIVLFIPAISGTSIFSGMPSY